MKSILVCCVLLLWGAVQAESNRFIGGHMQVATGYQSNMPTLDNYSNGQSNDSGNISGIPLVLGMGYTISLSNVHVLGINYEAHLLNTDSAKQTTTVGGTTTYSKLGFGSQQQVSVVAGYLLNPYAMVYGKFGYATLTTVNADNNFSLPGVGIGVGYKSFFNNYQYFFTEYNQTHMSRTGITSGSSTDTFDARSTGHEILFGVGLQF